MDILKQADSSLKQGKAELKTGVFKWSKDYNSAVTYFDEAAKLYIQAKAWEKAISTLEQCKLCNEKLNEVWGTARNLEAMVNILIDNLETKDQERLIQLNNEACIFFRASNSFTESIKLKTKVAKYLVKNGNSKSAMELLELAIQDADESEKVYNKKEVFDYYIELLVDIGLFQKAITVIKAQFENPSDEKKRFATEQNGLCIVVLCLLADEVIRADEEFSSLGQTVPGFFSSREYDICEALITAFREGDQEAFSLQAQKPNVTNLFPTNIPRLLKKKKLKNAIKKEKPIQQKEQNQPCAGNNFIGKAENINQPPQIQEMAKEFEGDDDANVL